MNTPRWVHNLIVLISLVSSYSSTAKRYVKKAIKLWLYFDIATRAEWELVRDIRYAMSFDKGIHVLHKRTFISLLTLLLEDNLGNLFVVRRNGVVVAANVMLFHWDTLVYLYWVADRSHWNIGAHHFLMHSLFLYGLNEWFAQVDLLWAAPVWDASHSLSWVSSFKRSFWWNYSHYLWSYDYVFSSLFYTLFSLRRSL